ncbi:MAG TPA: ABC transporter ATP-binding protein [Gaiellaceae bacterium]|nr:ABC transporter ATP-binding protein [Gaiellaceae bacterium]
MSADPLVRLRGVRTYFHDKRGLAAEVLRQERGAVYAVDGVDLEIPRGQIVGLVGESGSGKTTLGRTIVGLQRPTAGEVLFDGHDLARARRPELRGLRRRMQMIFQDAHASLSPRYRVSSLLAEPYRIHGTPAAKRYGVAALLEMVELSPNLASHYPHQLSGGQARRVGIARALALHPEFVVADELTSGLDVSAAAAVLNLVRDLRGRLGLTYLVITHDLNVVGYLADTIAVMYLGRLVELGPAERIYAGPAHPYTQALFAALPEPNAEPIERRLLLPGEIPSPRTPPAGCRFHTRCAYAGERSRSEQPALEEIETGHFVACHYWREVRAAVAAIPSRRERGETG